MSVSQLMLPPPAEWHFGGAGVGSARPTGLPGEARLVHSDGGTVALYCDLVLPQGSDLQLYLLAARLTCDRRSTVTVAAHDGTNWYGSEENLSVGEEETLSVRFRATGGDAVRLHVWVSGGTSVTIHWAAVEPITARVFDPPPSWPPLLTEKPAYMDSAEWREFGALFAANPLEGNRYLNDLEIRKSVPVCSSWPQVLQLSLSSYCNIMCRFCGQTRFRELASEDPHFLLDDLTVDTLRDMFRDVGIGYPFHVDFAGYGEPIVNPHFIEILDFVRARFPFSRLRTCTNGLALTPEMTEALIDRQLDWLNISLNAATRESWEITTGNRHFDRVIENIRHLQRRKRALGVRRPAVGVSYVLTRHSLECLPEFVDLCVELGADSAAVTYMTAMTAQSLPDSVVFTPRRANEVLRAVRDKADRLGFRLRLPALFEDDEAPAGEEPPPADMDIRAMRREYVEVWSAAKSKPPPPPRTRLPIDPTTRPTRETVAATRCRYPWDYLLVSGTGDTRICCGGLPPENGSIAEAGFWKIWNAEVRQHFRRTVNTAVIDEHCYFCPHNATRDVDETGTHMRHWVREGLTVQATHEG